MSRCTDIDQNHLIGQRPGSCIYPPVSQYRYRCDGMLISKVYSILKIQARFFAHFRPVGLSAFEQGLP